MDCDVCGRDVDRNYNEARVVGRYQPVAMLCFLHAEASRQVAVDGVVNWLAMAHATVRLRQVEPDLFKDPDAYARWSPLPRLVELYAECLRQYPVDLPPPPGRPK